MELFNLLCGHSRIYGRTDLSQEIELNFLHPHSFYYKIAIIVLVGIGCAAFFIHLPPIPQPLSYHQFADQRTLLGIPNFWNVILSFPLIMVSSWALYFLASAASDEHFIHPKEKIFYVVFFI